MRLVLRPLLSFIVLVALVIALLQGVGRVAFALLAHVEVAANQILASRQIRVSGLRGDWRGFNPVARIGRLDLPAGHVADLYVELDLLQTLIEGRPVLHRARVGEAALLLEKPPDAGWRLAGMPRGDGFDPLPYLTETDQLQFAGTLGFAREGVPTAEVEIDYVGTNRSGSGRHRLIVRNGAAECAAPCELRVELQRAAQDWGFGAPATAVTLSATRFLIPEALLGFGSLQLDAVEADWQQSESALSAGRATLAATGVGARDGQPFGARLDAVARGDGDVRWGRVRRLELEYGDAGVVLPPLDVVEREGVLHAALPEVPLAELLGVIHNALAWNDVANRWLDALAVQARVRDLRAFYRLGSRELGYGFAFDGFDMDGYRGVPWVRNGAGTALGFTRLFTGRPQGEVGNLARIDVDASDLQIAFPDHVDHVWELARAQGRLLAFFRRDELGFVADQVEARLGDASLHGRVGISRLGRDERDRRIAVLAGIDRVTLAEVREFVPFTLPTRLYQWLTTTPAEGVVEGASVAYQGQFRVPQGEPGRRLEIAGRVREGSIRFHEDWPAVEDFDGWLEVAGREVRAAASAARSLGADLSGSRLRLRDNGAVADLALEARADAAAAFDLVRQSPLQKWLAFVEPDWAGSGPLQARGSLTMPIRDAATAQGLAGAAGALEPTGPPAGLAVDLTIDLQGVDLALPGYRLAFGALTGPLAYRYPDSLQSSGISGVLFDAPVRVTADAADGRFGIEIAGTARSEDIWRVIDVPDPGIAAGAARFQARLDLEAPAGAAGRRQAGPPPRLSVSSLLEGMTLRLPAQYAKLPEDAEAVAVDLEMPQGLRRLTLSYRDATGWLAFGDRLEQGSLGLGIDPPAVGEGMRAIVLSGDLDRVVLDDLPLSGGAPAAPPLPIRLRDVQIDELALGSFTTANASLDADWEPDGFVVRLESDRLDGTARRGPVEGAAETTSDLPIELVIEDLWLPKGSGNRDPLSVNVIRSIPDANVEIRQMTVGDADYGRWRFQLRREGDDLWLRQLEGTLRKVDVVGGEGLVWSGSTNRTTFDGELRMGNLAEVLPLWGYAPSVESKTAELKGTVSWPGSPAAFELLALTGQARIKADTGRFLEVETGGGTQRIMSLLNFATIAKRMALDFSDVFGKGISFDKLKATVGLDPGMLEFVKPLDVDGSGLKLRMTGVVRLPDRVLDHEMIVTLPVTRSLPWYAAYVGLANPIAGLGVLVGERMLRKPLEQFSSAKYRISGTVENPKVELVSVFDTTTSERAVEVPVEPGPEGLVEKVPTSPVEIAPDEAAAKEQQSDE